METDVDDRPKALKAAAQHFTFGPVRQFANVKDSPLFNLPSPLLVGVVIQCPVAVAFAGRRRSITTTAALIVLLLGPTPFVPATSDVV